MWRPEISPELVTMSWSAPASGPFSTYTWWKTGFFRTGTFVFLLISDTSTHHSEPVSLDSRLESRFCAQVFPLLRFSHFLCPGFLIFCAQVFSEDFSSFQIFFRAPGYEKRRKNLDPVPKTDFWNVSVRKVLIFTCLPLTLVKNLLSFSSIVKF